MPHRTTRERRDGTFARLLDRRHGDRFAGRLRVGSTAVDNSAGRALSTASSALTVKRTMLLRAGVDPSAAGAYELDHFVPLAIGGHSRTEDNLWLQRWDGAWNARVKDRPERELQVMVCAGEITLHAARTAMQHDWHAAYRMYVADEPTAVPREMGAEEEVVE